MAGGEAGGIASAAALLREHGGAVEADLQRYYGLHVGDFPWPLTARRLIVLLKHLPADSATQEALADDLTRGWTEERQLLATVVDELRLLQYQRALIAGAKNVRPPDPIPRPGVRVKTTRAKARDRKAVDRVMARRGITIPDELRGGR